MLSEYLQVRDAGNVAAYEAALVAFANGLDFSTISAIIVTERVQESPKFISIGNTPAAFSEVYNDAGDGRRDPVLQRLKTLNCPIVWDQDTYVSGGAADLWERQAPFEYHTGIAMALHLPHGKHFYLGVDRRAPLPTDESRLTRMVADLQLLAVYAQDAAVRLFDQDGTGNAPSLTAREREVLYWTVRGKTAWAISKILGVTENTVHWHAQRALRKLGCDNKHSAALKARELGVL